MANTVLEVKNLTKNFGSFRAVDNLSFTLADGEILGLLGPNGAGKTTTIQMLLGVMDPSFGEISYFGKPFHKHRSEILKRINFSSTYIALPWHFTVWESLDVFARLYEIPNKKGRILKLLEEFEIAHLKDKNFFMLSAGEKTRLILVKSFLNYPKILLLDEPTASLDPDIAVKVRDFLKKQQREYQVGMLFTSHNMAEVEEMCDQVIIIHRGQIIAEDSPENLAKEIQDCQVELLIKKDAERADKFLTKLELAFEKERHRFRIMVDESEVAELLTLLTKESIEYEEVSINKPDLEDFFLKVIKEKQE
ncbi:ABC transporter ATP-binding protein [Candidatus Daviesbacteria bacterium]|nr:ABC transporter ATP-binding protein [Candidatus Daviesbacteria bacterium]